MTMTGQTFTANQLNDILRSKRGGVHGKTRKAERRLAEIALKKTDLRESAE